MATLNRGESRPASTNTMFFAVNCLLEENNRDV